MPFILGGASIALAILLAIHVVRTGRELYWLWIILVFQPLGGLVYFLAVFLPEVLGGSTARRIGQAARETLDPTREYREAKLACDDAPTVRNQTRLADAASKLGKHDEAEALFRTAAQGIHAEDAALLLGRANALIELTRPTEALALLERLGEDAEKGRTPAAALAMGRAYEALGRNSEADTAYQWAAQRLSGFEAMARYAAFMARRGRKAEAQEVITDMDRRIAKTHAQFRKEGRAWRDLAAQALAAD